MFLLFVFLFLSLTNPQADSIWKECFKNFVGALSVQIIRDVEQFVKTTPFAEEPVMRLLTR